MQDSSAAVTRLWRQAGAVQRHRPCLVAALVAGVLSGWIYWAVLGDLRSVISSDRDVSLFVWSMEHAPRQLLRGRNPFLSSDIFATSGGANLAYNATAPGLAVLMSPVTAWLGPVAAVNVLTWLTPVLNSLAARRLLRLVTGRADATVTLGALLIGFSPIALMHNGGRFQIAFQAVVLLLLGELCVLVSGWLRGDGISIGHALAAGTLAGAQLWIGTELLAISVIVAIVALVAALVIGRGTGFKRPAARDITPIAAGLACMVAVASPFLIVFFAGREPYPDSYHVPARPLFGLRLANSLTPTEVAAVRVVPLSVARDVLSVFPDEDTGYITVAGIVILAIIALTWRRRTPVQRGAFVVAIVAWLFALGPTVRWSGTGSGPPGPWRLMETLPVIEEIVANRFSFGLFVALGVVVAAARSTPAERRLDGTMQIAAWLCLPVLLFPAQFERTRPVSRAAEHELESRCRDRLVIIVPQPLEQEGMAWQARSDFAFALYRGFAFRESSLPKGDLVALDTIATGESTGDGAAAIEQIRGLGIGCVVTPSSDEVTVSNVTRVLGPPIIAGDVAVWPDP